MMLLDVGNTSLKWRLHNPDGSTDSGRFIHAGADFQRRARAAWGHLPEPATVVAANVAGPGMEATIRTWSQEHWQIVPVFVRPADMAAGVANGYTMPETLGADRWAALIAARHTYSGAVCVIDCGTAITIDLLDASGCHRGGLIVPGIGMMKHALQTATAGIGAADGAEQADVSVSSIPLARATQEAVNGGVLYMARAMLEHAITDIHAACGVQTAIVMTGGDATRLLPLGGIQPLREPDLVLNGLAILAGELQCVT